MSREPIHILLVEDEEAHAELARRSLRAAGQRFALVVARTLGQARARIEEHTPDLVIADLILPDGRGLDLLPPGTGAAALPVVIMTAYGDERAAVEAIRAGAIDYVVKSHGALADMAHTADRALRQWAHLREARRLEEERLTYQRRLHALASQLVTAEDRERRRVADDLHDGIGQTLSLAKLKLEAFGARLRDDGRAMLDDMVQTLDRCIEETRTLAFSLSPPILFELGLPAAAEWLAADMERCHGLRCRFRREGPADGLPDDLRALLFRAMKELLTNVVKHARAREACVLLRGEPAAVHLIVEDDGEGFDATRRNGSAGGEGFGLFSLDQRLGNLGGKLLVESQLGAGTRVTLSVPLPDSSPSREE